MKKYILVLLLLLLSFIGISQNVFMNGYLDTTGTTITTQYASNALQLASGDYFFGSGFGFISRINSTGETQWTKLAGHNSSGGYIYPGNTILDANEDVFMLCDLSTGDTSSIIKMDNNGNKIWDQAFAGDYMKLSRIKAMNNGDVVAIGYYVNPTPVYYYAFAVRLNSQGAIVWQKLFLHPYSSAMGGHGNSLLFDVTETSTGDLLFCGASRNVSGTVGNFILKTSATGSILWTKQISPFVTSDLNEPFRINELANGNIKLAMRHPIQGPTGHIGLAETDNSGNVLTATAFNDTLTSEMNDAYIDETGNVVISAGSAAYFFNSANIFQQGYSYLPQYYIVDQAGVNKTNDGGFILSGAYSSFSPFFLDAFLTKTTSTGTTTPGRFVPVGLTNVPYSLSSLTVSLFDSVISINTSVPIFITNLSSLNDTVFSAITNINHLYYEESNLSVYPNPSNDRVHIVSNADKWELTVYDYTGRIVLFEMIFGKEKELNLSGFNPGVYFVSNGSSKLALKKIIKY